ncbi:MAG TPA: helix-turn-helix transcriptional regulator [Conexibacter sp.]|nr:helix-turn-helix transcriptional regulator [Conexibacter sp.]
MPGGRSPYAGSSDLVALGIALRELRERRRVQQKAVGFDAGLADKYVGMVERGELNPTFAVLLRVLRTLRVPLSELVELYERNVELIDPQAGEDIPACPTPEALAHIGKTTAQTAAYNRAAKARRARGRMGPWT